MDDANIGKDHAQAHAHVHAEEVYDYADKVHDHAGEEKIIVKPMLMFMLTKFMIMLEKIRSYSFQAHAHVHVDAGEDHLVGMLSIGGPSISAARAVSSNKCPL